MRTLDEVTADLKATISFMMRIDSEDHPELYEMVGCFKDDLLLEAQRIKQNLQSEES